MVSPSQPRSLSLSLRLEDGPESVRHLPLTERVTLGPRPTDTFSIAGFTESHTLITAQEDGHQLLLSAALGGTLERQEGQRDLGTLWRPDGRLPLQHSDRLALTLQGLELAVEFSASPPEAAKILFITLKSKDVTCQCFIPCIARITHAL